MKTEPIDTIIDYEESRKSRKYQFFGLSFLIISVINLFGAALFYLFMYIYHIIYTLSIISSLLSALSIIFLLLSRKHQIRKITYLY